MTLPFISNRILDSWLLKLPFLRLPIDDFESFVWVFIWALLHELHKMGRLEQQWVKSLQKYSFPENRPEDTLKAKDAIMLIFTSPS